MLLCSPRDSSPLVDLGLIDQLTAQSEAGGAALPEAEFDQAPLPGEDLDRQLAAVLAGHRTLDALDDG